MTAALRAERSCLSAAPLPRRAERLLREPLVAVAVRPDGIARRRARHQAAP
ncbi:hypothetical protein [Kitasatospora sp. NPDC008115]|uniref:hypothetical protein n=1 Tax=Kitasatospora sp. NPDC008115 TaxID=3364022 RepID=UPI0036E2E066